jgi:hypothetical protein
MNTENYLREFKAARITSLNNGCGKLNRANLKLSENEHDANFGTSKVLASWMKRRRKGKGFQSLQRLRCYDKKPKNWGWGKGKRIGTEITGISIEGS